MHPSSHARAALAWFIAGLLLTTVLANVLGFLSPIVSGLSGSGDDRMLLRFAQTVTPWFGWLFGVALWCLSRLQASLAARLSLRALAVAAAAAFVAPLLVQESLAPIAVFVAGAVKFLALLAGSFALRSSIPATVAAS